MANRKIKYSDLALSDLDEIKNYIAKDSPSFATRFIEEIFTQTRILDDFPTIGRVVPEYNDQSVRQLIKGNYRIIYTILEDKLIIVLRVIHGARQLEL